MGECDCGSSGARYRLPAPDGGAYVIQLQPPCTGCPGPAGVAAHRYAAERVEEVEGWPALELHDYGHGYADTGLVVLDVQQARAALMKHLVEVGLSKDEFDAEEHAREILDECLLPLLFKQPERNRSG
ncbi:hypothetical protein [Sorangium sp. So ce388]|uniref:hypothetical protein n=1 Tax=Sorangium sp. So ce388 TaxID=3133309 RepID=UPI003F5C926E